MAVPGMRATIGGTLRALRSLSPRRARLWVVAAGLVAASLGCGPANTTYPFNYFPEMHYQSSIRFQEPPRRQPPRDSVPVTGKELAYNLAEAEGLKNPIARNQLTLERGKRLFEVNCSMCHGMDAKADTHVADHFKKAGATPPIDLTRPETQRLQDGVIFWTITNGRGNMPSFKNLLSEDDRWSIALHIRNLPPQ